MFGGLSGAGGADDLKNVRLIRFRFRLRFRLSLRLRLRLRLRVLAYHLIEHPREEILW